MGSGNRRLPFWCIRLGMISAIHISKSNIFCQTVGLGFYSHFNIRVFFSSFPQGHGMGNFLYMFLHICQADAWQVNVLLMPQVYARYFPNPSNADDMNNGIFNVHDLQISDILYQWARNFVHIVISDFIFPVFPKKGSGHMEFSLILYYSTSAKESTWQTLDYLPKLCAGEALGACCVFLQSIKWRE